MLLSFSPYILLSFPFSLLLSFFSFFLQSILTSILLFLSFSPSSYSSFNHSILLSFYPSLPHLSFSPLPTVIHPSTLYLSTLLLLSFYHSLFIIIFILTFSFPFRLSFPSSILHSFLPPAPTSIFLFLLSFCHVSFFSSFPLSF
jgi:hypothetical protein